MTNLPDHQTIEDAFKATAEVIGRIPESTETKRAAANLDISEKLTYEAQERASYNAREEGKG